MNSMEHIRHVIEKEAGNGFALDDRTWGRIKAAIEAAQPPDKMDEICAALRELAEARDEHETSIVLFGYGAGRVRACDYHQLVGWSPGDDIPAAILALMPKPEPTREEDWKTVEQYVREHGMSMHVAKALARLRKQVEDK